MKYRLDVSQLRIGMYVCELDRPWLDTSFLFQGFPLRSTREIEKLQSICQYVYVDGNKSITHPVKHLLTLPHASGSAESIAPPEPSPPVTTNTVSIEERIRIASETRQHARNFIDGIFTGVRSGEEINLAEIKPVVGAMVNNIIHNPDAQLCLTQLKRRDEYTAQHSVNVCVLSIAFARHMGMEINDLNEIGMGAILHDIGKLRVPLEILNKPGKLTGEEFAIMKRHPELGAELLRKTAGIPHSVIEIVQSHHERHGGHGYPQGVSGKHVGTLCRMVSIVDVYDAISSDRVYHDGESPTETLLKMYRARDRDFDHELLEQFIQCIGIYPIGSLVELTSGEVGITISVNGKFRLKPRVLLIMDGNGNPCYPTRIVDLASYSSDESEPYGIKAVLEQGAFNIDISEHLEPILKAKQKPVLPTRS